MLAGDLLDRRDDKAAVVFEDGTFSYALLNEIADRFCNFFLKLALEAGDRVSFLVGNDPLLVAGYFGAFRCGVMANPINNRLTPGEIAYILNHAGSRLVVVSGEFVESLAATLPLLHHRPSILAVRSPGALPFPAHHEAEIMDAPASPAASARPTPEDGALLIYTSGTTGNPKGVVLTHHNVASGAEIVRRGFEIGPEDRTLCVMPLFHTNGLMFSHLPFLLEGATVILRRRFSASALWTQCKEHGASSFSASPTILAMLLEHEANAPPAADIHLKYVKVASAPTSVDLATRFERRFGEGLLLETFGLTETTAITTMNPLRGTRKFGSIGRALEPQEVRVCDQAGQPLAPGEVGEICVRGPTVMREYFRDPDNTAKTIRDGWLHTGDLARMDEDGFVTMVGRKKEMIVRGGENISPLEVEQVVARHPAVQEAAVVGLPDRIWGEIVGLCVVPGARLTEEDILDHCRAHLSAFKVPERVRLIDALPRNAMGKVIRNRLRDQF